MTAEAKRDADVGHTVDPVTRRILHLSVSSLEKAGPRVGGCFRRFFYDKVLGDKEPEKEASKVAKKKGTDMHDRLAQYLRGAPISVLKEPEILGKHMLPVPGPDLWVEQPFHRVIAPGNIVSSLYAAGIPIVGYIDLAQRRGFTWTEDGIVYDPHGTIEVADHKFKSNAKDRDGNSTFKQPGELVQTIQMGGYGMVAANTQRDLSDIRLSHLYYPEKGGKPTKVTRLHVIDDCQRTWDYAESVARDLIDIVKETNVDKVPGNVQVCDALGGCPFRGKCTAYHTTSIDGMFKKAANDFRLAAGNNAVGSDVGTDKMGIIANNPQLMQQQAPAQPVASPATAPQQPQQPQTYASNPYVTQVPQQAAPIVQQMMQQHPDMRAALAQEEAAMKAQQIQQQSQVPTAPPPSLIAECARLQALGRGMPRLVGAAAQAYAAAGGQRIDPNAEYPGSGDFLTVTLSDPAHVFAFVAQVTGTAPAYVAPTLTAAQAYNPFPPTATAAPSQNFTQQVAQAYNQQVPPAQQIQQPQAGGILAPGTPESQPQLAQEHAAPSQAEAEPAKKGRGRPKKDQQAQVSSTAPESVVQTPTAPPTVATASVQQTPPAAAPSTQVPPAQVLTSPSSPAVFVNSVANVECKTLYAYIDFINSTLAKMYCNDRDGKPTVQDIRCAPKDSIAAFGGWKGLVYDAVVSNPPPRDTYRLDTSGGELYEVVAAALATVCERAGVLYVRGVR